MNLDAKGKTVVDTELTVDPERLGYLEKAIGTDSAAETARLVPFFGPTAAGQDSVVEPLGLDLERALQGGQAYEWHRAFEPGETVRFRVRIEDVFDRGDMQTATVVSTYEIHRRRADPAPTDRLRGAGVTGMLGLDDTTLAPITQERVQLFGDAVGDYNPVHFDEAFAQRAGLPTTVVHGPFTATLVLDAIVGKVGAGRLLNMDVRLRAPVHPGDELTVRDADYGVSVDKADGTTVATAVLITEEGS